MRSIIAITPDGHEKLYWSITEFIKENGGYRTTIDTAIKTGKPVKIGRLKGWRFEDYKFKQEVLDTPFKQE